jgi:CHAT domain-containing protein/tetratricopeptide (TPR) repeat protein
MLQPQLIDHLLTLPSVGQQTARLRADMLLTTGGLSAVLDAAERLVGASPDQAYKLAQLCEHACLSANLFAVFPRTAYLRAQIHAIKGEFATAQGLIETARSGYENLGMPLDALRTNVGLMRVLGETGRYAEALNTGQSALVQIGAVASEPGVVEPPEYRAVAAMLLQNCGFCYEQIGRYEEALAAYAAAEARYQTLDMTEQQAHIIENRGAVLMAQGRVQDALAAFMCAQQIYAQAGLDFYQAQTLINIGEAQLLLSNYMPGLQAFEQATRLFTTLGDSVDRHILLRHMGDAYLSLNLHAEALDAYGRAKAGLQAAGLTLPYALALWGLGVTQIARNQLAAAQQALGTAAEILCSLDNRPLLSALLLEQSRLLEVTEGAAAARTLARQALALVEEGNWTVQKIYAYLRTADLALPDLAATECWLGAAQGWIEHVELPQLRYRLQQRWGHLRLLQGDAPAAQRYLEQAIDDIERLRNTLVQERLRVSFLDDKSAAYEDLVQLHLLGKDRQSIEAAFAVTERAKSRALVDLISGAIQIDPDEPPTDEITAQLQSYQAELSAIYNEMLAGNENSLRRNGAATPKVRAAELEQAISHLRLRRMLGQGQASFPGQQAGFPVIKKPVLPEDTALVVYHIVADEILAFVWIHGELHTVRNLTTATYMQQLLQRLTVQWARFRTSQPFIDRHQHQLEQSVRRLLQLAYTALLARVEALLQSIAPCAAEAVRKLVIVPHRFLHQLPFHALHDGHHYLVERCAISYAPSATVFTLSQQRTPRQTGLALAVAAPDAQIPAAAVEAQQVAQRLDRQCLEVRLLLNEQATLAAVTALAPQCSRLHLACHGLFRSDNPMFSAIKLHDAWLTATDVAQLNLTGALVTLSACESGRSQVLGGGESIGLVYAFLSAGAATLLVSQWLVQDEVTARLMDHCYSQLATTADRAEALRRAQCAILAALPHPYYWAPFVLIGQRAAAESKFGDL